LSVHGQLWEDATAWLHVVGSCTASFDRERILPFLADTATDPFAIPAVFADDTSTPDDNRAMTRATIATWQLISTGRATVEDLVPTRQIRRALERGGLSTVVHAASIG
jgi:hypothetical protein